MSDPARAKAETSRALAARAWAEVWPLTDRQLSPLGLAAMDELRPAPAEVVLDIGCGAGGTLIQLAERVGETGQVIGVDIAPDLLTVARGRTAHLPQVRLLEADAQRLDFPAAGADAVFSRFGVMAFAEPVAAFANLRRILKPGGRLAFCCWRALEENELDWLPVKAAGLEAMVDAGPFSLADAAQIRALLRSAGFRDIAVQACDGRVSCGDIEATLSVVLTVGALGRILRENSRLRAGAEPCVRGALAALPDPTKIELGAAAWIVTASA